MTYFNLTGAEKYKMVQQEGCWILFENFRNKND